MKKIFFLLIVLAVFGVGGYFLYRQLAPRATEQGACALEAKVCPNGSLVGRIPPQCDFAPCPGENNGEWMTKENKAAHTIFQYPASLPLNYIHAQEWPPELIVRSGRTDCLAPLKNIHDVDYCIERESEGAAGSTYTTYTYSTYRDTRNVMISLKFTLRYVQCDNYDEPKRTECKTERDLFNLDDLIVQIINGVGFTQ